MRPWPLKDILSVAIITILMASALWAKFTSLPWWLIAALFVFLAYLSTAWGMPSLQKPVRLLSLPKDTSSILSRVLWGIFFCAPVFTYLVLTWNQEFPYFGDQEYHAIALINADTFWATYWLPAALLLIVILAVLLSKKRWNICWIAVPFLLLFSHFMPTAVVDYALRYPSPVYTLQVPFVWFVHLFHIHDFVTGQRLLNALSIPVWLFALRPLLVSRWPDIRALPFVAFFFFHKDTVYYFTTSYLEAWPLVFVILAVECILVRGREELWIATLLLLFAAFMKDQFIFVLPLPLLAGLPLKRLVRNVPLVTASLGSAGIVLCYLILRFTLLPGGSRPYFLLPISFVFSAQHLHAWWHVIWAEWQMSVLIPLYSFLLLWIAALRHVRRGTWAPLAVAVMGVGLLLVFLFDINESISPGYSRYYLLVWAVWGMGILIVGHAWKQRSIIALSAIILLFNGIPLGGEFVKAAGPDSARNFLEHPRCSGFFPVRALVSQAEDAHLLEHVSKLRLILHLVPTFEFTQKIELDMSLGYADLSANYDIRFDDDLETDSAKLHQCTCSVPGEAAVFLPLYLTNMRTVTPEIVHVEETAERCRALLEKSCTDTTDILFHGKTIGVLGVIRGSGASSL